MSRCVKEATADSARAIDGIIDDNIVSDYGVVFRFYCSREIEYKKLMYVYFQCLKRRIHPFHPLLLHIIFAHDFHERMWEKNVPFIVSFDGKCEQRIVLCRKCMALYNFMIFIIRHNSATSNAISQHFNFPACDTIIADINAKHFTILLLTESQKKTIKNNLHRTFRVPR